MLAGFASAEEMTALVARLCEDITNGDMKHKRSLAPEYNEKWYTLIAAQLVFSPQTFTSTAAASPACFLSATVSCTYGGFEHWRRHVCATSDREIEKELRLDWEAEAAASAAAGELAHGRAVYGYELWQAVLMSRSELQLILSFR